MITTTALTKSYGRTRVVDAVSFHCEPGAVTGFLGPNGAGKSTTLRMIVGLARPDHGQATIDGQPFATLANPARVVGALLDAGAMNSGRTGRSTLAIAARMAGVEGARVGELLELVGLGEAADKRVGTYSLGMRQRLGLAHALVGEPSTLILDEPANGLDPEGIAWMRDFLRDFADRGGTVLLSSHLLHEVQAIADHLVVIARGAVVASGALRDLLAASLLVRTPEPDTLAAALSAEGIPYSPRADQGISIDTLGGRVTAEVIARVALDHRVLLTELRPADSGGVEELFFSLTTPRPVPGKEAA